MYRIVDRVQLRAKLLVAHCFCVILAYVRSIFFQSGNNRNDVMLCRGWHVTCLSISYHPESHAQALTFFLPVISGLAVLVTCRTTVFWQKGSNGQYKWHNQDVVIK